MSLSMARFRGPSSNLVTQAKLNLSFMKMMMMNTAIKILLRYNNTTVYAYTRSLAVR